jgi:hypothetical protein
MKKNPTVIKIPLVAFRIALRVGRKEIDIEGL